MKRLIRDLTNGKDESKLNEKEFAVVKEMFEKGILFRFYKNKKTCLKFCNNVSVEKSDDGVDFVVVPNRYIGVIFDDNDDMISTNPLLNNHFILVDYMVGLTKEDIIKAKEII